MKRFTDTAKWQKEFYQDLTPLQKCLWFYLCDNCDSAGVWEGNWRLATFQIGETVSPEALKAFGERVEILPGGRVWIVGFVAFQNGKLSAACKPHIPIIKALEKHGLSDRYPELLDRVSESSDRVSIPIPKGMNTLEGKEEVKGKGKDKERVTEEEGPGETSVPEASPPQPAPTDANGDDRELAAEEIGASIQRIFRTDRKPGNEAMHAIAEAMPVKVSEMAVLERFYALPQEPDNPRLARCVKPTNLALSLGDELVKARDYFTPRNGQKAGPHREQKSGHRGLGQGEPDPSDTWASLKSPPPVKQT